MEIVKDSFQDEVDFGDVLIRLPALVGTGNATSVLRDGMFMTVDGNSGQVEVVDVPADAGRS